MPFTVTQIAPNSGHTGGRNYIEIRGTGFRVPQKTQHDGFKKSPPAKQTMRVLFDGVPALRVEVANDTTVRVYTPPHAPDKWAYQFGNGELAPAPNGSAIPPDGATLIQTHFGTVPVTVENIDATGTAYPGESITLPNAFTYRRPRLDMIGPWQRVLEEFVEMLEDQVYPNVAPDSAVDYDPNTGSPVGFIDLVDLPGIAIVSTSWPSSQDEAQSSGEHVDAGNDYILVRRPALMNDMVCTLVVVAEARHQILAIGQTLTQVFRRSGSLTFPNVVGDPSAGMASYRYAVSRAGFQLTGRLGNTNNLTGSLQMSVKSIPTDYIPGAPDADMTTVASWQPHDGVVGVTRRLIKPSVKSFR